MAKFLLGHKTNKGKHLSDETKEKLRRSQLGRKRSEETRKKLSDIAKSRKYSLETREKMSKTRKGRMAHNKGRKSPKTSGAKNHLWRGGITPINQKIRTSLEYHLWREAVFKRDNWTCIWCGQVGGKLNADHIKPFALYPELRFAIDNGRTLCVECHKKTDTYAGRCIKRIK